MNPKAFVAVARMLWNPPPLWVPVVLETYASFVVSSRGGLSASADEDEKLIAAAKLLERELPTYVYAQEWFGEDATCVEDLLAYLPEVIELLEETRAVAVRGPPRDRGRRACAQVCAEVWRRRHGEVQPLSENLQRACERYWQACGNPQTGVNLSGWEEPLKDAKRLSTEGWRELFDRHIAAAEAAVSHP